MQRSRDVKYNLFERNNPAGNNLLNKDTLEQDVFIINFKHISHHVPVFLLFTLNR